MPVEAFRDERDDLPADGVGREPLSLRAEKIRPCRIAVFAVEIPASTDRRVAFHQQAGAPAHLAVEELHGETAPAGRPLLERRVRTEETVVGADLDRAAQFRLPVLHVVEDPPFAGLCHHDRLRCHIRDRAQHFGAERTGVVSVVEPRVADAKALLPEFLGEVTHGREDEGDLLLVVAHIGGFRHHLAHQHDILRRIGIAKAADAGGKLVAEDQDEVTDGGHGAAD